MKLLIKKVYNVMRNGKLVCQAILKHQSAQMVMLAREENGKLINFAGERTPDGFSDNGISFTLERVLIPKTTVSNDALYSDTDRSAVASLVAKNDGKPTRFTFKIGETEWLATFKPKRVPKSPADKMVKANKAAKKLLKK